MGLFVGQNGADNGQSTGILYGLPAVERNHGSSDSRGAQTTYLFEPGGPSFTCAIRTRFRALDLPLCARHFKAVA